MNREEEIKKLVDEMTPNVLLYVETLMEHYEKLENENLELKRQLLEKRCCDKDIEYKEKIKLQKIIDRAIELTKNLLKTEDRGYYQILFKEILKSLGEDDE